MKGRLPLLGLLASALVFLASLFLPWREIQAPPFFGRDLGVLTLFEGGRVDGWIGVAADVAVLLAVALVLAVLVALRRPRLAAELPLGSLGVALAYFAAAVAVEVNTLSRFVGGGFTAGHPPVPHTSWSYGFYLGLASGAVAGLCGLAVRANDLLRPPRVADAVAGVLGIALLVSFLLPWIGLGEPGSRSYPGIETGPAVIAALLLILAAGRLRDEARRRWRLPVAIAAAILTGAAASTVPYFGVHLYGTWVGIGCAVLLTALEAARTWPLRLPAVPRGLAALRTGSAALLLVALFLPWETLRGQPGANGWSLVTGAAVGGLCLLLLATPAIPALERYVLDAVVAVVLMVSALGTAFRENRFIFHLGYGAFVGFAAAGVLLVSALVRLRPAHVAPARARPRTVPLAASVLGVAAFVLPWWFVLPEGWTFQASALYGWMSVAGLLLALYLVRLWARLLREPVMTGPRLTLAPLALLTLASLELIRFRAGEVVWGAVILVGLCLLLALCGWIEEGGGGLEGLRVPEEIWRVDRLPETES